MYGSERHTIFSLSKQRSGRIENFCTKAEYYEGIIVQSELTQFE